MFLSNAQSVNEISAQQLKQGLKNGSIRLVDVREAREYAAECIPGAELHPLSQFDPQQVVPSEGQTLVLYCHSGMRSALAAQRCLAAGVTNVSHLPHGIFTWKQAGFQTERGQNQPLGWFR